jgi:hypothetical protein
MRWGRRGCRASPELGSLLKRLQALEDTPDFSNEMAIPGRKPATVADGKLPGLMRWLTLGFVCAFIGGGIALLALLLVHPVQAKLRPSVCATAEPMIQSLIPETRRLWWKLPTNDRIGPKLARAHE